MWIRRWSVVVVAAAASIVASPGALSAAVPYQPDGAGILIGSKCAARGLDGALDLGGHAAVRRRLVAAFISPPHLAIDPGDPLCRQLAGTPVVEVATVAALNARKTANDDPETGRPVDKPATANGDPGGGDSSTGDDAAAENGNAGGNDKSNAGGNDKSNAGGNDIGNAGGNDKSNAGGNDKNNAGGNGNGNAGGNDNGNSGGNGNGSSGGSGNNGNANGSRELVNEGSIKVIVETNDGSPASATGLIGGNGKDLVDNRGTVEVGATARLASSTKTVTLTGGDEVTETTVLESRAVGIDGGNGKDRLVNSGTVTVAATSVLDQFNAELNLVDTSHADTTTTIRATAVGVDGGNAKDTAALTNSGTIAATAAARSTSIDIAVNGANAATASSSLTLEARATGIESGQAKDAIDNRGAISATSNADVIDVSVGVTFLDVSIADRGTDDATTNVRTKSVGIDTGRAKDAVSVDSSGSVTATARSFVNSTGVSLDSEGVSSSVELLFKGPIAEIGITADSSAIGISGTGGKDAVSLAGALTASAEAIAQQQSIGLGISVFNFHFPTPGFSVSGAGTKSTASAVGVATGDGKDETTNSGSMNVTATSKASTAVVQASLADLAIDVGPKSMEDFALPLSYSVMVADAITESAATATGIAAGADSDSVANTGSITVTANANGGAVNVSAAAGLKLEDSGKDPSKNAPSFSAEFGVTLARASIVGSSQATGIDGGSGRDVITSEGSVAVNANTTTYGVSVDVGLQGPLDFDQGKKPSLLATAAASDTSNTASAAATALAGGEDDDRIVNSGPASATARSDALNVTAGIKVKIEEKGALLGVSLVDSDATATASAVGIDGGTGEDRIENADRVDSTASANATSVSATVEVQRTAEKGLAASVTVLDADTTATASAIGMRSGDLELDKKVKTSSPSSSHGEASYDLRNAGIVNADANATTTAVNATVQANITKDGAAVGVALSDTSANASALSKGIEGDLGVNRIANEGSVNLAATSRAVSVGVNVTVAGAANGLAGGAALTRSAADAEATAVGIDGGAADDLIVNSGSIATSGRNVQATATTVSVGLQAVGVTKQGAAIGAALTDTKAASTAAATGIDGGSGLDTVANRGSIALTGVGADTTAVGVSLNVTLAKQGFTAGAALAMSDATSTAAATGIAGGADDDALSNEGRIALSDVTSDSNAVSVALDIGGAKDGLVLGAALVDADAAARTTATGADGGAGRDRISNTGTVAIDRVRAESDSVGVSVEVKIAKQGLTLGAALVETGVVSSSSAAGLSGGENDDELSNDGAVAIANVTSAADAVSVAVSVAASQSGLNVAAGLADASASSTAAASGMDGGSGDDAVTNRGTLSVTDLRADGNASAFGIALAGADKGVAVSAALADTSATSTAIARGIDGGEGSDALTNKGSIDLARITADTDAVTAEVSLSGTLSAGIAGGAALGRARATAVADVAGIDGGAGDDSILNTGSVKIDSVSSVADATSVSVQLGVVNNGLAVGAALVDTSSTASTVVAGLKGGAGNDALVNERTVELKNISAEADAVAVGVSLNAAVSAGVAAGVALVDGKANASVQARGIDGGDGDDLVVNRDRVAIETAKAAAHATGVSVTLNASMAGAAGGAAIANTSASASAGVIGMAGGAGDDQLLNQGSVAVQGAAESASTGVSVALTLAVGVGGAAEITDVSSTAASDAIGMDGGEGRDRLRNEGTVSAVAAADARGTAVSVGINAALGGDYTVARAASTADAYAVGLRDDDVAVAAPCTATSAGERSSSCKHADEPPPAWMVSTGTVSAAASAAASGTSIAANLRGYSLGDLSTTATARASGILSGAEDDAVVNESGLTAVAGATADGLSVAVTVVGAGFGGANSTATAEASAIVTGAGNDAIDNRGALSVAAGSVASAKSIAVGVVGMAGADATTTASATARGIAGGDGDDAVVNTSSVTAAAGLPEQRDGSGSCTEAAGGACVKVTTISVTLAGYADGNAAATSTAAALGLDGGAGNDTVENRGSLTAKALGRARADGTSVAVFGASNADASTTVTARATGIAGDSGDDTLFNESLIRAHAAGESYTKGFSFSLVGSASSAGNSLTSAFAAGITGGDGADRIVNRALGALTVRADTQSTIDSSSWTFAGGAASRATLGAETEAVGIEGGAGADAIVNLGTISVATSSQQTAQGGAQAILGNAEAGSRIAATSRAIGVDAGAGDNVIENSGSVRAESNASMAASTTSASFAGAAATTEFIASEAHAAALSVSAGTHSITNDGSAVAVVAGFAWTQGSSSTDLGGDTATSGTVASTASAFGVDGSAGAGTVVNRGTVRVDLAGQSWATHSSDSGVFFSGAGVVANSSARIAGAGIALGDGENVIVSSGLIELLVSTGPGDFGNDGSKEGVFARAFALGSEWDFPLGNGDAFGTVSAAADVKFDGIAVGLGLATIRNEGRIRVMTGADGVKATTFVDANGGAIGVDGDGAGTAYSALSSSARGIAVAGGKVAVGNFGEIEVDVAPAVSSSVDADAGASGDADVFVDARVSSAAVGIQAGDATSDVLNRGTITVVNRASASASGDANGQGIDGDGRVGFGIDLSQRPGYARVDAVSAGIDLGTGVSRVVQEGTLRVTDGVSAGASAMADADCGLLICGNANSFARGEVDSTVIGIRTRAAGGSVWQSGTIELLAAPAAHSYAGTGDGGRAEALSDLVSRVYGVTGEGDGSEIANEGRTLIDVDAKATSTAEGIANAGTAVEAAALLIDGSSSAAYNTGRIEVRIQAGATATSSSLVSLSTASVDAVGMGLRLVDSSSSLKNGGSIDIAVVATGVTETTPVAIDLLPPNSESNSATARAFGVWVGTALPMMEIVNDGTIAAAATSIVRANLGGSDKTHVEGRALADAIGVLAEGRAAYSVTNGGTIRSTASAASEQPGLGEVPLAQAVGIRTGSGNDTIVNHGTITATNTVNGTTSPGIAIDAGAGDDTVVLGDASVTRGTIDLGTGNNVLSLTGTPVFEGNVLGNATTLQLNGTGRFTGPVPVSNVVKLGTGTYTLSALGSPAAIEVRQGTLRVDGDVTLAAQARFVSMVNGDGAFGQLHATGQASVAGRMKVERGESAFADGMTFDVLKADRGIQSGTSFSAIELPEATRLVSFSARQGEGVVRVQASVQSFATVASSESDRAIARQLDRVTPAATGSLQRTLGQLQSLQTDTQFRTAFSSLSPLAHERYSAASLSGSLRHAQALHDRLSALRIAELSAPLLDVAPVAFIGGPDVVRRLPGADERAARGYGLWQKGFALRGRQAAFDAAGGFRNDVDGMTLGFDQQIGRSVTVGMSYGEARTDVQANDAGGEARVDSGMAAFYAGYFDERLHFGATLAAGRNDYEARRSISVGDAGSLATSKHRGHLLVGSVEAGYLLPAGKGWIDPFVAVQFTRLDEEGFVETGSAANVVIAPRSTSTVLSTLGLRWSHVFNAPNGASVVPELSLGWIHDFSRIPTLSAAFVEAPDVRFSLSGRPNDRDGTAIGLGLTYRNARGLATFLRYAGDLRGAYASHSVIGEFRYEF